MLILWSRPRALRGVLRQRGQTLAMPLGRSDDFHLLPVIRKLSAAIEAGDVSSGQRCRLRAPFRATNGYWKAVVRVSASKNDIDQFCNHDPPSIPERASERLGFAESARPLHLVCGTLSLKYLDSPIAKRVEDFVKEAAPGAKGPEAISLDIVTGVGKRFTGVCEWCRSHSMTMRDAEKCAKLPQNHRFISEAA